MTGQHEPLWKPEVKSGGLWIIVDYDIYFVVFIAIIKIRIPYVQCYK